MLMRERKKKTADRHLHPKETFHADPEILTAMNDYLASAIPKTSKSAFIREAIVEKLMRLDRWPKKD